MATFAGNHPKRGPKLKLGKLVLITDGLSIGTKVGNIEWPWMAIILRYFAKFSSFRNQLRKSGWLAISYQPIFSWDMS